MVAVAKWWLMAADATDESDEPAREAKRIIALHYGLEVHRACQHELVFDADDIPVANSENVVRRLGAPGWPAAVRRSLGDIDFDQFEELLSHWHLVTAVMKTVTSRARAVLITVELASFYPWPPDVKFKDQVRERELGDIVEAMAAPISRAYFEEIDRALVDGARKLALKNMGFGRLAVMAGAGAFIIAASYGAGAPWVAGMLSGAAGGVFGGVAGSMVDEAQEALFGNPMAHGGFAVAGETLRTTASTASAGGSGASFADIVKLDVLTQYYLIRERDEPDLARAVVAATEKRLAQTESEIDDLREQVAKLSHLAELHGQTEQLLHEREAELEALKQTLADAETAHKYQQRGVAGLLAVVAAA